MGLNTEELIARVQRNTNRTDKDTAILDFLNDALKVMARRHEWRDLRIVRTTTLTTGEFRYSFPDDMRDTHGIRIIDSTSSVLLVEKTKLWLNNLEPNPDSDSVAKPAFYAVDGNYFEVFPRPDQDYTIYLDMTRWPTALVNDADTPELDQVDDVLVAYATAELYASIQMLTESERWERRFETRFKAAWMQDNSRPNHQPVQDGVVTAGGVGPVSDYWNRPFVGL